MKYILKYIFSHTIWLQAIGAILLSIFFTETTFAQTDDTYDWFWMIYEKDHTQDHYKKEVYRPFFLNHVDKKGQFQASVMPLLFWRYETPRKDEWHYFFGLGGSVNYRHRNNVQDYDLGLFPFFYYGDARNKDDQYLLIWPLGGTLKQKFAHDEISAYIFPGVLLFFFYPPASFFSWRTALYVAASILPLYATFQVKDYRAWSIMWPLVYSGKSENRRDFRILPFYAHNSKKGWYDNYSFFMIINYQQFFYRKGTQYTFFIFPLYGRKWSDSGQISATTVLWPFFSWGYNKKNNDRSYNLPWPFIQIQDSDKPKIYKRIFFPFYGDYRYESNRTFFVTPLHFTYEEHAETFNSKYNINGLVFWYFKRDHYETTHSYYGNSWRFFKIWPLFQIEYNDIGDYSFNFLSILPFRDNTGYETMYQPFWSLIEYRRLRNGEKRFGFLFRTYFQRWGPDYTDVKIPLLFTYKSRENILTEFSLFLSMFGYVHNKEGRYIKFIWLPIRFANADETIVNCKETIVPLSNYEYYCSLINLANERSLMVNGNEINCVQVTFSL